MSARGSGSIGVLLVLMSIGAAADSLPERAYLPLAVASSAAHAALDACQADGYRVSVAVVDRHGVMRVQLHGDGAGPHTLSSSVRKAFTAASMRRSTAEYAGLIADTPALAGLRDMDERLLFLAGGLPIRFDGEVVAGIGVGGAPGGDLDEACARAGLEAIGAGGGASDEG